jgi:hypothetical protein
MSHGRIFVGFASVLAFTVALGACGGSSDGNKKPDPAPAETKPETKKEPAKPEAAAPAKPRTAEFTPAEQRKIRTNRGKEGTLELNALRKSKLGRKATSVLKRAMAKTKPGSAQMRRLGGTWRLGSDPARYWAFWTEGESLHGVLLNPPFDTMQCEFAGTLTGNNALKGVVTWTEGKHTLRTAWDLTLVAFDTLEGRIEEADWEDGKVYGRTWLNKTMLKVSNKR